jgi:chromosome segregation ATPase
MQARQLVLQKELEVKRLRAGLAQSEQEGNGCLEALDAALDIMAVTGTAPEPPNSQPSVANGADDDSGSASMSTEDSMQLQQQYQALQEHNTELQSTLAEAGQQLDFFEAQLQQLTAEKAAVEQQLASMQELLDRRQAEHEAFLQSELDEQQQQHEEEVEQLHERLNELRDQMEALGEAAAASKTAAEQSQAKASSLQQQLAASEEHTQGLSQQLEQLQAVLRGQESESAASSEQLSRQVAQLLAAQQELQQANARLLEAEAEYASNQLALGCRNQELSKQLQVKACFALPHKLPSPLSLCILRTPCTASKPSLSHASL